MMKQYNFRLSTRIIIGAIFLVVAGFLVLILVEEARLRDIHKSRLRNDLEQSLYAEKLRLSQAIDDLRQDVLFLSNTPPVSGIMRATLNHGYDARDGDTKARWEARLQQIFSAFSASHPEYYQIRYIGLAEEGREIVRIDNRAGKIEITPPARLQAKGDRDYFKAALGLHAGEVYLSEFNLNQEWGVIEQPHRPTLRAVTPVFTSSGQIFGMVVINMEVGHLLASAALGLPAGVRACITNMNGEYLLHPDQGQSFGFELGRTDKATTDFPLIKTLFNPQEPGHFPLQAVAAKTGMQYLAAERVHFDSANPARFLLLAYYLPDAVLANKSILIPPERLAGGFVAMLLVSGIALLALRRMFYPLDQITVAADKIAAGNRDVLLPQTGSGEIGSLAKALGAMLSKLSQREKDILQTNEELEERVKDRTIELEHAQQKTEKLLHELSAQQVELEMQNAELQRAQSIMEESRDRYVDLYDFAPVGYLTLTREALISEINLTGAALLGKERDKLLHSRFARLVAPEDSGRWHMHFMGMLQHGDRQSCELLLRRDDGSCFHAQLDCLRLINDGNAPMVRIILTDITERKRAEEALCIAAAAFETQDAIMITDAAGSIIQVNRAFSTITGYGPEDVLGKNQSAINPTQSGQDACVEMLQQATRNGSWAGEIYDQRKNGQIYPKWMTVTAIKNKQQETTHHVSIFSDITERKQIEEARLRESEERFRGTLEQAAVGIAHSTLDGYFQQVNQKFCNIVGYTRDELVQMSFQDISFPDDLGENLRYNQQLLAGEISTFSMEKRYVRKDRSLVWVNLTVSLLCDAGGAPRYTIGVIEDITGRKRVEQQMRDLSAHLQSVREEEKADVAREIHDDLGGTLTALKMDAYWLSRNLPAGNEMAPLRERVESMSGLLNNAVAVTRRVITDLRPTILDDLGLLVALEWHANQFSKRTGIECRVVCRSDRVCEGEPDKTLSINLFRIFQEALTNVARHSGASRVEAELLYENEEIILSISDNGRGLPEGHAIAATSYGIRGMCERSEQLGGMFRLFDSKPGGGLTVRVILPLPADNDQGGEA